mgnify:CR=1 FL=1
MIKLLSIVTLLTCFSVQASTVARVLEVKGNAFAFTGGKNPRVLKYGDQVEDLSDVMVEDSSQLSLVNTEGDVMHITGGTLLKVYKKNIELKAGQIWTVAKSRGNITTTNAVAEYRDGQFVTSFDNISGKTQVLVITGDVKVANVLEPALYTNVSAGQFSLVDPKYENNLPRTPTKVGKESFQKLRGEFASFETLDNPSLNKVMPGAEPAMVPAKGRTIASVIEGYTKTPSKPKAGKIIKIYSTTNRKPASAHKYYMNLKGSKKSAASRAPVESAKIRYFGKKWKQQLSIKTNNAPKAQTQMEPKRIPASIPQASANSLIQDLKKNNFEKSLDEKSKTIERHSDEVNQLIDNLKSYDKDYQKAY